jgi:hypothetical protein
MRWTGPDKAFLWAVCIALAIALVAVLIAPLPSTGEPHNEFWSLRVTDIFLVLFTFFLWWSTQAHETASKVARIDRLDVAWAQTSTWGNRRPATAGALAPGASRPILTASVREG